MRKMARIKSAFALAEPVPLTLASLIAKSLTPLPRGCSGTPGATSDPGGGASGAGPIVASVQVGLLMRHPSSRWWPRTG